MTIEIGRQLGPYRIEAALGAGGMGEVYRARDTRLDRTVAVKILPAHLSDSPDLRQRFEREAKVVSSLSHAHICTLYDVGRENGVDYLVMEHLEGETLAERLARGPLPMPEVLQLGIQIADALDTAHASGVVHRDLKPANVMLVGDNAKLLDFGLAKHQVAPDAGGPGSGGTDLLTRTSVQTPLTTQGTIVGTFQYMAPEQLEGQEADARSDLFALGAVLYEMASGRRPFDGKTQASLIGAIMQSDPPALSTLVPLTPPAFDRVVATCLAKDPGRRWRTAHDVKLQLEWIAEGGSQVGLPAPVAARRRSRERFAWAAAAIAAIAAIGFAAAWVARAPEPPRQVRFQIPQPPELPVVGAPKLSPDGRHLAFHATESGGRTGLWIRALDAIEPRLLAGTDGAGRPFWSPDGTHLGFFADGKLKKVAVTGAPPQVVCDAPTGADGTWSEHGVILYDGRDTDPIRRVAAAGGVPTDLVASSPEDGRAVQVGWP